MVAVAYSSSFLRAFKRISGRKNLKEKFIQRLEIFINDPLDPRLRTHKLSGKLKELWAFSVEYDVRVVFYFVNPTQVILVDIGSHDEVY